MGRSSIPCHSLADRCGRCIAALLVLMQLTDLAACGQTYFRRSEVDLMQIKHNIINGLNLDKLPDMAQVDISNDEFHCKYLEYFWRLYANDDGDDETAAVINGTSRGDDNGVSSVGVRGRTVIHDVDVGSPVPVPEGRAKSSGMSRSRISRNDLTENVVMVSLIKGDEK
ncbi:Hypothetical protein CINCED_3A013959 [Cinara cedri]|uniref:Uncharacterized protein n=1 Tax=Cinara cedri TaxID=506608 RepID=A0A5E4N8J6_9HEMI|nr:Hypothetical protein CINCED_3A013959 [Cinara cedri]